MCPLGAEAHIENFPATDTSQPLESDVFNCRGNENTLLECPRSIGRLCEHNRDVSVICSK